MYVFIYCLVLISQRGKYYSNIEKKQKKLKYCFIFLLLQNNITYRVKHLPFIKFIGIAIILN